MQLALNAGIASSSCDLKTRVLSRKFSNQVRLHWSLLLWCHCLSSTGDHIAILDVALDHPVVLTVADYAFVNAVLAEIKITCFASATVVVSIWDSIMAIIAEDREHADGSRRWCCSLASKAMTFGRQGSQFGKPLIASSSSARNRNLGARAVVQSGYLLVVEHAWN